MREARGEMQTACRGRLPLAWGCPLAEPGQGLWKRDTTPISFFYHQGKYRAIFRVNPWTSRAVGVLQASAGNPGPGKGPDPIQRGPGPPFFTGLCSSANYINANVQRRIYETYWAFRLQNKPKLEPHCGNASSLTFILL